VTKAGAKKGAQQHTDTGQHHSEWCRRPVDKGKTVHAAARPCKSTETARHTESANTPRLLHIDRATSMVHCIVVIFAAVKRSFSRRHSYLGAYVMVIHYVSTLALPASTMVLLSRPSRAVRALSLSNRIMPPQPGGAVRALSMCYHDMPPQPSGVVHTLDLSWPR